MYLTICENEQKNKDQRQKGYIEIRTKAVMARCYAVTNGEKRGNWGIRA